MIHTFDMMITDLKFLAVVIGVITIAGFIYSKYLIWKEAKLKIQGE